MIYVTVADADAAVDGVMRAGGEIVQPLDPGARERVASFRDPAGNVLGIYEQPGLAETKRAGGRATTSRVSPIPEHLRTVTPRLVVSGGADAIEFYRNAFGAQEIGERFAGPDGQVIHAELRIGDSVVMITDEAAAPAGTSASAGAIMATYWENVDAAWQRALEAGAAVIYPLADQFYGERGGRLRDPYGHQWMLSQRIEELTHEEIARRAGWSSDASG